MKLITVFIIVCGLSSCYQRAEKAMVAAVVSEKVVEIPGEEWLRDDVFFERRNSTWFVKRDSSLVSGHVIEYFSDGTPFKSTELLDGKKVGVQLTYFPDGRLRFEENYRSNRLHGKVRRWTLEDGYQLRALLQYQEGKLHGEQKKWYSTGELHKRMHLIEGKEEGLQQAFRKNGALYANYEAKNGRVFGLNRSNLCYELYNEQIVFEQE